MTREMAHCYRCGYSWFPRRGDVRRCAHCKSRYFDVPKLRVPTYGGGLGVTEIFGAKRAKIIRIARKYGATNVRVFGSVARSQATTSSDIDLLVDPIRGRFRLVDLALALTHELGRRVDVVSEGSLHWFVQPSAIVEAVPL
jgi:uncharacterized protein